MKVRHFIIRLAANQLTEDENQLNGFLESVDFVKSDVHFVDYKVQYWSILVHYKEKIASGKSETNKEKNMILVQDLSPQQKAFYDTLKVWRVKKAKELNIPIVSICHNSELLNAIIQKVKTRGDLSSIKGFGKFKVDKFGDEILSILNAK